MTLTANKPKFFISGVTASFASLGIDATKVFKIYEEPQSPGGALKGFNPAYSLNPLTGFTAGRGYLIYPKIQFDVTEQASGGGIVTLS